MITIAALWMPIVLSGVAVFFVSSILHMVLKYHAADYKKIPNEAEALAGLAKAALPPGYYMFPACDSMKEMGTPEGIEKFRRGPVGTLTLLPNAPMAMGKTLGLWFVYCLVVSFFLAYLAGRTLAPGIDYLVVFRFVGTAAFLAYGSAASSTRSGWGCRGATPCARSATGWFTPSSPAAASAGSGRADRERRGPRDEGRMACRRRSFPRRGQGESHVAIPQAVAPGAAGARFRWRSRRSLPAGRRAARPLAGQVYVANANADSVLVFDPAVGGPQAPLQEITVTPGFMDLASSVAVDVARNELFVAGRGPDTIYVFGLGANGPTAALRTISGLATTINTPWDLEVDWERGEIYVLSKDSSEILVFPVTATGNALPSRILATVPAWPTTTLDFDLDLVNDEIVVTDRTPGAAAIHFFALDSGDPAIPLRSITGAATGLTDPSAVAVDPVHDELFVVNGTTVRVFSRTATGNAAPAPGPLRRGDRLRREPGHRRRAVHRRDRGHPDHPHRGGALLRPHRCRRHRSAAHHRRRPDPAQRPEPPLVLPLADPRRRLREQHDRRLEPDGALSRRGEVLPLQIPPTAADQRQALPLSNSKSSRKISGRTPK